MHTNVHTERRVEGCDKLEWHPSMVTYLRPQVHPVALRNILDTPLVVKSMLPTFIGRGFLP